MANLTCANLLHVDHIRALRLNAAGQVVAAADGAYEHEQAILLGYTPVTPDRQTAEQRQGNGEICATYRERPHAPDSVDLTLNLCQLDAELIELLVGGEVITQGTGAAGDTIGWLAPTDSTVNEDGVALECWSKMWNNNQRANFGGQPGWFRHFFPRTSWQLGEQSISGEGFLTVQLTGVGEPNSAFGTGWEEDPIATAVGESPWGYHLDDTKPDPVCGYVTTVAA